MLVVRAVEGKAIPHFACAECGLAIVARGLYGWRWPAQPDAVVNGVTVRFPPGDSAAVSCYHPACAPNGGKNEKRRGGWEFADLTKLAPLLDYNFESFVLNKLPPVGHQGLVAEAKKAEAAVAKQAVLRKAAPPAPAKVEKPPPAPVLKLALAPPPPPAAPLAAWPCSAPVGGTLGDLDRPVCGNPCPAGAVLCEHHDFHQLKEALGVKHG